MFRLLLLLSLGCSVVVTRKCHALQVVLAGGAGPIGKGLASRLDQSSQSQNDVTILTRNAFLAAAPARVTETFGWVGQAFLDKHRNVRLRDWDGGDLLDIVGQDWVGWQDDALKDANVVVHLVGGFTEQRVMACERLIRESLACNNPDLLHVTVSPTSQDLEILSPGMTALKAERIVKCEDMVKANCRNHLCMRIETNRLEQECDAIFNAISDWKQ